jgi:hypothetical protein
MEFSLNRYFLLTLNAKDGPKRAQEIWLAFKFDRKDSR